MWVSLISDVGEIAATMAASSAAEASSCRSEHAPLGKLCRQSDCVALVLSVPHE